MKNLTMVAHRVVGEGKGEEKKNQDKTQNGFSIREEDRGRDQTAVYGTSGGGQMLQEGRWSSQ